MSAFVPMLLMTTASGACIFAGGMLGGHDELNPEILLQTSAENELVTSAESEPGPGMAKLTEEFQSSGIQRALAVRLSGKFKTAFPDGKPGEDQEEEAGEEAHANQASQGRPEQSG